MPRRLVPFVADSYYHIFNRGNNRQTVFFESENYLYFLRSMKRYISPVASICAYCLMPTHYHILIRVRAQQGLQTSDASAQFSRAMQKFIISYTKAVNTRYQRVGALFQGQFRAKLVQKDPHLLNLCVYIHANPVKDGLVDSPEDWIYSNYLEWLGERAGTLVDREFIREYFHSPDEYRELVLTYVKTRFLPDELRKYLNMFE